MAEKEYIERENYCRNICRCFRNECDKTKCPLFTAPAADVVEVRHGEWIDKEYFGIEVPVCSVCECESTNHEYHTF